MRIEKVSRTQKKKAAQAKQKMGEKLVRLNDAQFDGLELPEELLEAVAMARQIKSHEARRRQLQYIGRLMREYNPADIEAALEKITDGHEEKKRQFRLVERWRDELVSGNEERLAWLSAHYPQIDTEELDRLVQGARGTHPGINPKNAGRSLFQLLMRVLTS